jgi:hypothetical protein
LPVSAEKIDASVATGAAIDACVSSCSGSVLKIENLNFLGTATGQNSKPWPGLSSVKFERIERKQDSVKKNTGARHRGTPHASSSDSCRAGIERGSQSP